MGERENGRARGRHARGDWGVIAPSPLACLFLSRAFFLVPTNSKRLLRRLQIAKELRHLQDESSSLLPIIEFVFELLVRPCFTLKFFFEGVPPMFQSCYKKNPEMKKKESLDKMKWSPFNYYRLIICLAAVWHYVWVQTNWKKKLLRYIGYIFGYSNSLLKLNREVVTTPRCRDSKIFQQTVVLQIRQKQRTKLTWLVWISCAWLHSGTKPKPILFSIVQQCKWPSRKIVEIFCYYGNVTSHFTSLSYSL